MLPQQVPHHSLEFRIPGGLGEKKFLLRLKMLADALFKLVPHLGLPHRYIEIAGRVCPLDPHTEEQRIVMLMRKRHQVLVPQHGPYYLASPMFAVPHVCPGFGRRWANIVDANTAGLGAGPRGNSNLKRAWRSPCLRGA